MKYEWRKQEKSHYLPKATPEVIDIPEFKYIVLSGQGNPGSKFFSHCVEVLFSVAYAIKMNLKKVDSPPKDYMDWTVYPLEGVWDITEEAKKTYDGSFNKDDLVFDLMIRQPDYVSEDFFRQMIELTRKKKPHDLLDKLQYESITDGKSVQMLHVGSFDDEPASFAVMEEFAIAEDLKRVSRAHREIYLSDFRKVPTEKLKTLLRFWVAERGQ